MSQHCPSVAFLKNIQKQKIRINLFFRVGTNKGNIIYNGTKEEIKNSSYGVMDKAADN